MNMKILSAVSGTQKAFRNDTWLWVDLCKLHAAGRDITVGGEGKPVVQEGMSSHWDFTELEWDFKRGVDHHTCSHVCTHTPALAPWDERRSRQQLGKTRPCGWGLRLLSCVKWDSHCQKTKSHSPLISLPTLAHREKIPVTIKIWLFIPNRLKKTLILYSFSQNYCKSNIHNVKVRKYILPEFYNLQILP